MDILAIVTLGYLGLGIAPPTAEWGSMILDGQEFITDHWQQATIPGLAVVVTSLGLSFLGDGLADLLSPGSGRAVSAAASDCAVEPRLLEVEGLTVGLRRGGRRRADRRGRRLRPSARGSGSASSASPGRASR